VKSHGVLLASLVLVACGARAPGHDGSVLTAAEFEVPVPLGLELFMHVPDTTPITRERVLLGERLFLDPLLSGDGTVSCASCHRPDRAFADTVPVSGGTSGRHARRNTPTLLNVVWREVLMWDGRTSSLEHQVLQPIADPDEMGNTVNGAVTALRARTDYRRMFRQAFGRDVSAETLSLALAAYLRTLRSGDAEFDRWRHGVAAALTEEARRGFALFVGRARCSACHAGPNFTDGEFHNTGVAAGSGDPGRYAVTGKREHLGAFRTPTLRDIVRTAPYMHDGSLTTLEDVIDFYNVGRRVHPQLDPLVRPLHLSAGDRAALLAFLHTLTGNELR
jgi:cytochrome c peroxidase